MKLVETLWSEIESNKYNFVGLARHTSVVTSLAGLSRISPAQSSCDHKMVI